MANLAEKYDEEHSAQLADAEISRILSAMQKAEFKRSETGNARPDQTFKPRSLMEIAETAREQDEAAKAAAITADIAAHDAAHAADGVIDNTVDDLATVSDDAPTDDIAPETTGGAHSHKQQSDGVLDQGRQDATLEMSPTDADPSESKDLQVKAAGVGADAKFDSGTDNEVGPASPTSPFETAQTAYDRGYADGVVAGREAAQAELRKTIEAEFESKLAGKINAFETALIALAKPQTVDTRPLSASLQAAVVKLAAARTGAAIDQLPELMITRIENLADAAGKNVSAGHVFMHPEDCAVIAPIMEKREDQFKIEPDPGLYRGDIRIRFDGMDISDIADLRADWQISQSMEHAKSAEVETNQPKISDVELETLTAENLTLDSQDASVQSIEISSSVSDDENSKSLMDSAEENEGVSLSEAVGLMPLTTTAGDDSAPDRSSEDNEDARSSDAVGLMPLTTTAGDDSAPDRSSEDNEDAHSSDAVGLMPLTTTGGDESAADKESGDNEDAHSSEAVGLMPLTSKNIEE